MKLSLRYLVLASVFAVLSVACPQQASTPQQSADAGTHKLGATTKPIAFVPAGTNGVFALSSGVEAANAIEPGASGNLLTSNGTVWQSTAPSGGGGGWTTDLDCDWTAQANQTISADGPFTACGVSWKKENSAREATHLQIINGTGAVFKVLSADYGPVSCLNPGAGTGTDRSAPLMWLQLMQLSISSLTWQTQFEIAVDATQTQINNAALVFGLDNDPGTGLGGLTNWYAIFGAQCTDATPAANLAAYAYAGTPVGATGNIVMPTFRTNWSSANQTAVLWTGALSPAGGAFQPNTGYATAWSAGWATAIVPWVTYWLQPVADRSGAVPIGWANSTTSPVNPDSALGVVLGSPGNNFPSQATVTILHTRIRHRN